MVLPRGDAGSVFEGEARKALSFNRVGSSAEGIGPNGNKKEQAIIR